MSLPSAVWLPWIEALGWTLLHFVWQGLVVGAAFAAVRALLPGGACRARYAAGLGALALLAAWAAATFASLAPHAAGDVAAGGAAAPVGDAVAAARATVEGVSLAALAERLMPWLVLSWSLGVLAMAGRALWQWRSLSRIAARAEASAGLDAMVRALRRRFGVLQRVRVLVSAHIDTPMLIGWVRPLVLLPAAVVLGFPRQQVELVLAHELGHLRRFDHLVNLAQAVIETLFFYHPVVHWISREIRNERELCCDELVLRHALGRPSDYARTLAGLEELRQASATLALAASGGDLVERVRRIVGMPASRLSIDAQAAGRRLLMAGAFGGALLAGLHAVREESVSFALPRLVAAALPRSELLRMPLATIALPFERPRLRVAAVVAPPPPAAPAPKPPPPVATPGSAPRTALPATAEPSAATGKAPAPSPGATVPPPAASAPSPAVPVPAPARATADAMAPASPRAAAAPREVVSVPVNPAPARPVVLRSVAPEFPAGQSGTGEVEATFAVAPDGTVRDIRFVGAGAAEDPFARAAESALKRWRFDPRTVSADPGARYSQAFVFARRRGPDSCVRPTGSHICRDLGESAALVREVVP